MSTEEKINELEKKIGKKIMKVIWEKFERNKKETRQF